MELNVNGKRVDMENSDTLLALLARFDIAPDATGVAVAVNDTVVPRQKWAATTLQEQDKVEIIHAVQGG